MERKGILKLNNSGMTLLEIIVVIAILAIMAGGVSLSINVAFSRDASQCASKLNDALYEARMDSMSKPGAFYLEIRMESGEYVAVINDGTNDVYSEKLSENGKISSITCALNGNVTSISDVSTVKIVFDKSKGNVKEYNGVGFSTDGASGTNMDGQIIFTVKQSRGDRESAVTLVTSTGKHKAGN